ncbi:MAG TPA: hypothetical protein VK590_15385 [Saprospiraceae bacterium]|nr:hypothetical protein [Saprospiraceae bacterium]
MKTAFQLILLISFLSACSNNKNAERQIPPAKLEDVTKKIDTAAFFKDFPQIRDKQIFGTAYENLSTEKRIYMFHSRRYFGMNRYNKGSMAAKFMDIIFQDTIVGKTYDNILETNELKFAEGQSTLEGKESDEMKTIVFATYFPVVENLMFKINVNVNTKDKTLRIARLNILKQAMYNSGAQQDKLIFDPNMEPTGKEGSVSFQIEKVNK